MIGNVLLYISIALTIGTVVFVFLKRQGLQTWLIVGQFVSVVGMMGYLWWAFFANNFGLQYVYTHSSVSLEWYYKLAAVWAGSSGSLVFWMLTLSIMVLYFAIKRPQNKSVIVTILIFQLFIFASILISHPFASNPDAVADGRGLNYFLKSFWMLSHPPVVFIAYSFLLAPFGYTIGFILNKKMQFEQWRDRVLPWIVASWFMLGLGIALGAVWAYEVIGWGGYWSWDPIENASLIPWILLSCGLHSLIASKYSKTGKRSSIGYTLSSFVAVVLAVFMVRSGFLYRISVHAFATRPMAVVCTLMLLASIIISIYTYFKLRTRVNADTSPPVESKSFIISSWNILMLLFAIIVIIASFWPAISLSLFNSEQPVTMSFYSRLAVPTGILIMIGLVISSVIKWSKTSLLSMFRKLIVPFILGVVTICILLVSSVTSAVVVSMAFLGVVVTSAEITRIIETPLKMWGGRIAHIGVAILIVGIAFTSNCYFTQEVRLKVGDDHKTVAERQLKLENILVDEESGDYLATVEMASIDGDVELISIEGEWSRMMGAWLNEPSILRSFAMDVILTPDTLDAGIELIASVGESVKADGYSIDLISLSEDKIVFTLISENEIWEATSQWNHENDTFDSVEVSDKLNVELDADVNKDYATFTVSDLRPSTLESSGILTIYFSYKYFVTFVWLGMILALLGIIWVLIYRWKFDIREDKHIDASATIGVDE
jgi:c-type cytochrome biogenesis protein CcmF